MLARFASFLSGNIYIFILYKSITYLWTIVDGEKRGCFIWKNKIFDKFFLPFFRTINE